MAAHQPNHYGSRRTSKNTHTFLNCATKQTTHRRAVSIVFILKGNKTLAVTVTIHLDVVNSDGCTKTGHAKSVKKMENSCWIYVLLCLLALLLDAQDHR